MAAWGSTEPLLIYLGVGRTQAATVETDDPVPSKAAAPAKR